MAQEEIVAFPLFSDLLKVFVSHAHGFMDEDLQVRVQADHPCKLSDHKRQPLFWIFDGSGFFNVRDQVFLYGPHVAREEKVTLVVKIIIEGGFADSRGNANIAGRCGAVPLFKEELHGDVKDIVLLEPLFLHSLFAEWVLSRLRGHRPIQA